MAQQQRRRRALGCGEREASADGELDALGLGQHRRERAAAKPLLHRPGHVLLAAGAEDQQVRRLQAEIAPARPVEAAEAGGPAPALADQHRAALAGPRMPRQQCCKKGGGGRPVCRARARGLVQAVRREAARRQGGIPGVDADGPGARAWVGAGGGGPARRQGVIQGIDAERPGPPRPAFVSGALQRGRAAFERRDAPPQRRQIGGRIGCIGPVGARTRDSIRGYGAGGAHGCSLFVLLQDLSSLPSLVQWAVGAYYHPGD